MDFVSIDIETANPDYGSICQIGMVKYINNQETASIQTYVDPEDYFDSINIEIHGITSETVRDAPKIPNAFDLVREFVSNYVLISHTAFDKLSLSKAAEIHSLQPIDNIWLDSSRVARRAWPQFGFKGYGLANLCSFLELKTQHHVAVEDARAAGHIFLRASELTGLSIEEWFNRIKKPVIIGSDKISYEGDLHGPLYGETIVFTGTLSIPRKEAGKIAAKAGCNVIDKLKLETTILVVGTQDIRKLRGDDKSIKQKTAEKLISEGHEIRIISEEDFLRLVNIL